MKTQFFKTNPWIIFIVFFVANFFTRILFFNTSSYSDSFIYSFLTLYFIWIFYVYLGISVVDKEFNNNRFSLSFLIVFLISISAIIINQIISTTFSISMTLYVISFVALLYCLNFIIRKIVRLEKNKNAGFVDYLDLGSSLIIYVIGWYDIQRRIRRIILRKEKNRVYV